MTQSAMHNYNCNVEKALTEIIRKILKKFKNNVTKF